MEIQDANGQSSSPADLGANPASPTGNDVSPPSSSGQDAPSASESNEGPVSERDGLLAAIRDVVPEGEDDPALDAQTDPAAGQDTGQGKDGSLDNDAEAAKSDDQADPTEDELKAYTPNARKRIEGLVKERNALREQVGSLSTAAETYTRLESYLRQNRLENEEVNQLLAIGAVLKRGDFQTFLQLVEPYFAAAAEATGRVLPADLQRQVDEGAITPELAREVAVSRTQAATARSELAARTSEAQAFAQAQQATTVKTAVDAWVRQTQTSDPDYALKSDLMQAFARSIVAERGRPSSPQQAVEWAREAHSLATAKLKALRPAAKPTSPTPGGVHVPTAAKPEPRSLLEAVQLGLASAAAS